MLPWALYVYRLLDIPGTQQAAFMVALLLLAILYAVSFFSI